VVIVRAVNMSGTNALIPIIVSASILGQCISFLPHRKSCSLRSNLASSVVARTISLKGRDRPFAAEMNHAV
jgi:hypothetical protein